MKERVEKLDYIKIEKFWMTKEAIHKVQRQATDQKEKYLQHKPQIKNNIHSTLRFPANQLEKISNLRGMLTDPAGSC